MLNVLYSTSSLCVTSVKLKMCTPKLLIVAVAVAVAVAWVEVRLWGATTAVQEAFLQQRPGLEKRCSEEQSSQFSMLNI